MVYIKGLKFRGFKSFRKAEVNFPKGYVCLAGPNGSGKSNVADGIRFALGESSLKSLRAKKIADLINNSCKFAEVTLFIDGEKQYEIKRAINSDGKTLYKINGKRSTRTLVMEELRQYGLEAGSHNIIAQGQVQKIIDMNAKERRQIIDQVAGIAEFDAKKEEALRELEKVEQKITEAKIILGEREAALSELEKDKNDALAYLSAKESFSKAQASLANLEYSKLNKSHTELVKKQVELSQEREGFAIQSASLQESIAQLDEQKKQIVQKIGSSESREAALKEIEAIKIQIGTNSATLAEKRKELERLEASKKLLSSQQDAIKKAHKEASQSISKLSDELSSISQSISELEKKEGLSSHDDFSSQLEICAQKIISAKERLASIEASLQNCKRMQEMRKKEAQQMQAALGSQEEKKTSGEKDLLSKELLTCESAIEELFKREKELNRTLPELDKKIISLKENAATLRASLAPSAVNMALKAVEEMKSSGMKGIYGTVSSLISCDAKYSAAVEAAAGQRLNYVVVDTMDTAVKAIGKLKEKKAGRCTFIPLDTLRQTGSAQKISLQGCLGHILDFVDFDNAFLPAMQYVFSDTYLFDSVQSARKAGIGRARMVCLDGELIEKSGVISGGSQKGSFLSKSSLDKIEAEAENAKKEREEIYAQLYAIRNEMAEKRKEKAAIEVRLKSLEIESSMAAEKEESRKKIQKAIEDINSSLEAIGREERQLSKQKAETSSQLSLLIAEHEELKKKQAEAFEKAKQADDEANKKLREMHSAKSSLQERLSAKRQEILRLEAELSQKRAEYLEVENQVSQCKSEISSLESDIKKNSKLQEEKEKKLSEISSASQKLLSKLNELESQISDLSSQLGKLRMEQEKRNREISELEVKRQVAEQRLADLKATLEQYAGVSTIDASKQELEEISNKSKAIMDSLGNVNLRAPELYEEKKKDIEEIKGRVNSLEMEKNAVISMMDEIESKKRAIFMSTFTSINDNFKRLFSYAFKGEGTLVLEQPSNPFDSGLLVKVRDDGHDKYLDSMSGGEKSLLAIIFIFAIQMYKAAPFYILDEADAALDKENSRKLAELIKQMSGKTQFIVVTHNDTVLSHADVALGVTRTEEGSKIVGVQLTSAIAKVKKA